MFPNSSAARRRLARLAGSFAVAAGLSAALTPAASAGGSQCAPRFIADNIQDAVLALKATQYCRDVGLPYTAAEAAQRVESLRCGSDSSQLIDDLLSNFEQEYKAILERDHRRVVCMRAAQLSLD